MKSIASFGGLVALGLCLASLTPGANAGVVLDNLTETGDGTPGGVSYSYWQAQSFKTDGNYDFSSGGDYYFNVSLGELGTDPLSLVAKIVQIDPGTGTPTDVSGATLTTADNIPTSGYANIKFTPTGSFSLSSGNIYYLVLGNSSTNGAFSWAATISSVYSGTWTIPMDTGDLTWSSSSDQGVSWDHGLLGVYSGTGDPYRIEVAVPEPYQYALTAGLSLLAFGVYRRCSRSSKTA